MEIIRKARGTQIPKKAQRVFICYNAENTRTRDILAADILSRDAGVECVVSWLDNPGSGIDEEMLRDELYESQALAMLVTSELLQSIGTGVWPVEFIIAREVKLPVIPVADDASLFPLFTELVGPMHAIAMTDIEYRSKLKAQLELFISPEEIIKHIHDKAFTAGIFLSYRKKDIADARRFMKAFHDLDGFESISIWYDSFLTAGRAFDEEICETINKTDVFTLLVTPNIIEKGNYVVTEEYPYAVKQRKPIAPVEAVPTDTSEFLESFPGADRAADMDDPVDMRAALTKKFIEPAFDDCIGSERAYLLGKAYLEGINVERDQERAVKLLESAAETCDISGLSAIRQLADLYGNGSAMDLDYETALFWRKKDVAYSESLYGPNHAGTATSNRNIALLYYKKGDYPSALDWFLKTISIIESGLDTKHPDTIATYTNVASTYENLGEFENALKWYRKALDISEAALGVDHTHTASIYNNAAVLFYQLGNYGQALELYRSALTIKEKVLGAEHPDTASTYNGVALVYDKMGDFPRALEWYKKALSVKEKVLGPGHPDTAVVYVNIGIVLNKKGDYEKALEWQQKALVVHEKIMGADHPDTALTYNNIASVYSNMGDYTKAMELFDKALLIREKKLGLEHPLTASSYNDIAIVYCKLRDFEKALVFYFKALHIREKIFGDDHPLTASTVNNIAALYHDNGQYWEASNWYQRAIVLKERALGSKHPDVAFTCNGLAAVYEQQGLYNDALELYLKSFIIFFNSPSYGEEHQMTYMTLASLQNRYVENGGDEDMFFQWLDEMT